jgi:hypothetical protein
MIASSPDPFAPIRRLLMALAAFGLVGIATELVFLEHYEDPPMFIPLGTITLALIALAMHAVAGTAGTLRLLRISMLVLLVSGGIGVVLHYRGSLEFQVDMDPTLSATQLFWKVMHMKAPPTLAPGVLAQMGLLGLLSTYRHPAVRR